MVVFENGKPKRSDYRKFRIKTVAGANDYASIYEVLTRRCNRAVKEIEELDKKGLSPDEGKFSKLPDLIMIDGGKIQVNAALETIRRLSLNIPVCGMVKDENHRTKAMFFNGREISLKASSEGFKLLTRIQDEVHRFSVEYHRKLRSKTQLKSVLDDIDGVGEVRRKALIKYFNDIDGVKNAGFEELLKAVDKRTAENVYRFFHRDI
jgi:excinuclease ABC subunit C